MQKQRSEDLRLAWSSEEEHKKALVFTNLQSGYLIRKRVYLHFKSAAAAIGVPDNRVHDLRHTYTVLSKIVNEMNVEGGAFWLYDNEKNKAICSNCINPSGIVSAAYTTGVAYINNCKRTPIKC